MPLGPLKLLALFLVGAAGGLVGDHGHVVSGTTFYLNADTPFIWDSPWWFAAMVGTATAALADLRMRLAPARPDVDPRDAIVGAAAVIGIYAITAMVSDEAQGPATALVVCLTALLATHLGGGAPALICGTAAAVGGAAVEIALIEGDVFKYTENADQLWGVPLWLPVLYFAFGVVAARLGEIARRPSLR